MFSSRPMQQQAFPIVIILTLCNSEQFIASFLPQYNYSTLYEFHLILLHNLWLSTKCFTNHEMLMHCELDCDSNFLLTTRKSRYRAIL